MMAETSRTHLYEYFPGNFVWSQSINSMIDMANWGASSMGEIDQVGRRLMSKQGDNEAWFNEWQALAEDQERKAASAAAANHQLTAGTCYLHAGTYHLYAERFIPPSERKFESYRKCMHCFEEENLQGIHHCRRRLGALSWRQSHRRFQLCGRLGGGQSVTSC